MLTRTLPYAVTPSSAAFPAGATYLPTKMVHSPVSTVAEGVEATMRLIAGDDVGTGAFCNGLRPGRPDPQAADPKARRELRDLSVRLTGVAAR